MGKNQSLQQMVLGKLDSNMQKTETRPLSYTIHKNKLKTDERPKCETRNHKILEENIGSNFSDIGCSNIFLGMSPDARETKAKINYWDYIKIITFFTAKEATYKTKR